MIVILEKTEHNIDFHQIVDFLEASHIWYALTISPTVYVSHIRQFWSTARIETTNLETKILTTVDGKPRTIYESSLRRHLKLNDEEGISSLPNTELFENLSLMGYNIFSNQRLLFKKANFHICESFLSIPSCNGEGSATPTEPHHTPSPQEQHLPHHDPSSPSHTTVTTKLIPYTPIETPTETPTLRRYTRRAIRIAQSKALSPAADEPASLLRDDRQGEAFPTDIGSAEPTQEDALIKGGIIKIREEVGADKSTELGSNDTYEMVNVLSSMEAANILTSGVAAKVVESEVPKKRKIQEQIDAQVAREMEEEFGRENKRLSEQLARDSEIARLHAEEELKMMIEGLDRSNEVIAKHLQEYKQAKAELTVGEKIELINELVKYQDHHAKILKYQAQQSKPLSKKEQREFYMSVLRSRAGWKTKHFKGMTLEEIKEKFIPVWKQLEDFVPMSSKEESEKVKRKGLKLGDHTAVYQFFVDMLKQFDKEDLQQLWTLVKETLSIKQATKDKEKELWVELKRLFRPNFEDQLWTHNQALMHDPLEWKFYDTCGVHHVFTKDQEIFMLVEKDYPLRKGLATVMICNKLQVKQ
nr:hypothetical protein [Tanacetum cinerariifolium]